MIRISELRERDVVNVNDGRRLGLIKDLDLDLDKGLVKAIIIPAVGGVWGKISRTRDYVISWDKIVKIGVDTILVDYPQEEYHRE
ncbi:MAG: YlmC/YmxH family sporulation protein [Bacillota bacterium]